MKCAFCTNEGRYACIDGALACALCAMERYPNQNVRISDVPALERILKFDIDILVDMERKLRLTLVDEFRSFFGASRQTGGAR